MSTVVNGERHATFPCIAGVPQGCPASATLFVLAMIPILRLLKRLTLDESHMAMSTFRGLVRAYADDHALAHASLRRRAPRLRSIFEVVRRSAASDLKVRKPLPLYGRLRMGRLEQRGTSKRSYDDARRRGWQLRDAHQLGILGSCWARGRHGSRNGRHRWWNMIVACSASWRVHWRRSLRSASAIAECCRSQVTSCSFRL